MLDEIMSVLNEYDLEGLIYFDENPDEYSYEGKQIISYINNNKFVTVEELANEINNIFMKSFGSDGYNMDMLLDMATDIMNL